jgi:hypothetical protein
MMGSRFVVLNMTNFHVEQSGFWSLRERSIFWCPTTGNTKGGSISVQLTSCLTGLDYPVLQLKAKIVSCYTAYSKPVKQEVNGTVILPPFVFPAHYVRIGSKAYIIQEEISGSRTLALRATASARKKKVNIIEIR